MKRVFLINRYFYPDPSATSQILTDLAFHLAATGREIHVIATQQRYDDPSSLLPPKEVIKGVNITRVSTTQFGRTALVGRGFDYLSFYISAARALHALVKKDDIIVAMTDPPLMSIVAMGTAKRNGARLINWLQDLYPEVAIELGITVLRGPLGGALAFLRNRTLRVADANVVVGQRMRDTVATLGLHPPTCVLFTIGTDDEQIRPVARTDNPLRRAFGLENKFVVGYSGNLGRAHEFDTLLGAAERLQHDPHIVFAFFGGGHRMPELESIVKERRLDAIFRFFPYQDRDQLKHSLCAPDVHWISLKPSVEGLIVPSKFYGIAAAGRPIIAITARNGEIARLVLEHNCGVVVAPRDSNGLADDLEYLSHNPKSASTMGANARKMLDKHFTRSQALER